MIDKARMNDRLHYLNDNFFGNKKKKKKLEALVV